MIAPTPELRAAAPAARGRVVVILIAAAVLAGAIQAARLAWTCDDAYISFRYAENLVQGQGLVFNAGERVEGYSNFLWTLWCAVGMFLRVDVVAWAWLWGIACYAASIALLGRLALRRSAGQAGFVLPLAALLAAVHRDWSVFATSGLETSMFTLLVLAGYALLAGPRPGPRRLALAGLVMGLVALARPDGILFGALVGLFLVVEERRLSRGLLLYGVALAAVVAPYAAWKLAYYGDLRPNTYYAKSAELAWYEQGFHYARLYFKKYTVLLAALPLAGWALWRARGAADDGGTRRSIALAALFALASTAYVIRVGGDFMFARFLIPATPFYLILLEAGWDAFAARSGVLRLAGAVGALAWVALSPYPVTGRAWRHGIANEHAFYDQSQRDLIAWQGEALRVVTEGLPIRMSFAGAQAGYVFLSRVPVAIESATGLTDSFIARQPLTARGRVGHEKNAPWDYLISTRRCHFLIGFSQTTAASLQAWIPVIPVLIPDPTRSEPPYRAVNVTLLTWDPPVMAALRQRGARCDDFLELLDAYIAVMPEIPDREVARDLPRFRRFYFDAVTDSARLRPFLKRLGAATRP